MTFRQYVCFVLAGLLTSSILAQTGQTFDYDNTRADYRHNWSFGAGVNIIDDSGEIFGGIQNPDDYWNFSTPFYISAEYYLNNEFSFLAMLSMNGFDEGKQIDNAVVIEGEEADYYSADFLAKYSFRDVIKSYKFDPFVGFGFGYSSLSSFKTLYEEYGESTVRDIPSSNSFTINGAAGFNYWISNSWGINMNIMGKWNTDTDFDDNLKEFSLGAVYFLP